MVGGGGGVHHRDGASRDIVEDEPPRQESTIEIERFGLYDTYLFFLSGGCVSQSGVRASVVASLLICFPHEPSAINTKKKKNNQRATHSFNIFSSSFSPTCRRGRRRQ
jgi:hypothetical protein